MPLTSVAPILTPQGRLTLVQDNDAAAVDAELAQRVRTAFARGSGHGLLQLGANEIGVALPATLSYWRAFAGNALKATLPPPGGRPQQKQGRTPLAPNPAVHQLVLGASPANGP